MDHPYGRATPVLVALLLVGAAAGGCGQAKEVTIGNGVPVVVANDNRVPAGRLRGDTLTLRLVVQKARWFPESDSGVSLDVPVFAEEGRAPQIPGPLVRVERGTMITLAVRNGLPDSTLWLHGFMSRPAVTDDSVAVKPGATTTIQFAAGAPGTYIYWARAGLENFKDVEREQLAGAFVVDSANGRADDRVLVINIWGQPRDSVNYRNALAINGKSWPHNERLTASVGDSVHWRVVNASAREHPMHLHGFYYRVDARGSPLADTSLAPAEQRQVVTEVMPPGGTMSIVWSPDRPGNWLFHCHIGFHVLPDARLDPPHIEHDRTSHDPGTHMSGLVLGISVKPSRGWRAPIRTEPRRLRLFVQEGKRKGRALRALGYVLQQGPNEPALDSVEISGSQLVLTRGEPSDITVINRLREATAIHWHGIELESYWDGVAGWSGIGKQMAPVIAPGDSFVARLTLPRAGTFMYHTHLNDFDQLTSGLYGPIVVLEPGKSFDPRTDHVFIAGWDGPQDPPHLLINGDSTSRSMEFASDAVHRMRFVNIGVAVPLSIAIERDGALVSWRPVAKDGADLPESRSVIGAARYLLDVGETADFQFTPPGRGDYQLRILGSGKLPPYIARIKVR